MVPSTSAGPSGIEKFKTDWQAYIQAPSQREKTISHTSSNDNYGSAVRIAHDQCRKGVSLSFLEADKEGLNEDAVFKIFYLRIQELYKMEGSSRRKLAIRNQPLMDDRDVSAYHKYDAALIESIYTKLFDTPFTTFK